MGTVSGNYHIESEWKEFRIPQNKNHRRKKEAAGIICASVRVREAEEKWRREERMSEWMGLGNRLKLERREIEASLSPSKASNQNQYYWPNSSFSSSSSLAQNQSSHV